MKSSRDIKVRAYPRRSHPAVDLSIDLAGIRETKELINDREQRGMEEYR